MREKQANGIFVVQLKLSLSTTARRKSSRSRHGIRDEAYCAVGTRTAEYASLTVQRRSSAMDDDEMGWLVED
jgi:hypothetical protein